MPGHETHRSPRPTRPASKTAGAAGRILGLAFLLQAVTSLGSGLLYLSLADANDIGQTLARVTAHPDALRWSILGQMVTAFGIVFLGAVLYRTVRDRHERLALTAFGLYIVEATLLAVQQIFHLALLHTGARYTETGRPTTLESMGQVIARTAGSVGSLHMVAFCVGAAIFYYLLYAERTVPRPFSIWGLLALIPCLVATLGALFDRELPTALYAPYVPFEFVIGLWILICGVSRAPSGGDERPDLGT